MSQSANLWNWEWGRGCVWAQPDQGVGGGSSSGLSENEIDHLQGLAAKEAVETLALENPADKLDIEGAAFSFPGPIAEAYYWDDGDVVGICGPVGSGKTTTKMKRKLRRAIMMPMSVIDGVRRYKVLFIRETYRQLWSTTIPSYLEVFPKSMGTWSGGRGDPVTHVINFEDEFGPIEFIAEFMAFGDDIIASMRGVQTTDIDLNEADTMPVEILTVGIGRIDRWPARQHFEGLPPELRSYGQIDCDQNAPDEENWTYRVFWDEEERTRMADQLTAELPEGARPIQINFHNQPGYRQPGTENLQNLSPTYYPRQIASMKLAGRGDMIDRLVYNKVTYLRAGEPVFQREFNRRIHVSDVPLQIEPGVGLRIGLDQGFKGAAVIGQFIPPFHWVILRELHFPRERLFAKVFGQRLSDLLEEHFRGVRIEAGWGDVAGESGSANQAQENEVWNRIVGKIADFRVRPQRIGANHIQPRLEAVRAALEFIDGGKPGLLIDPSCKFLIRGFEARYVWKDEIDKSGDKRKVPDKDKTEANVIDALQYLLLSEHRGDGLSRVTSPENKSGVVGHGRQPAAAAMQDGLQSGFDIMDPYAN
ncbi:MAG: hypothetical protein AAFX07_00605 [Pseudomonadota bacterium]